MGSKAFRKIAAGLRDAIEFARIDANCTCRTPVARSTDIDPPEYKSIRDPWCPVHGKDPDEEYEKMRERECDR